MIDSLATDGKIQEAKVFGIQKRYETEKYYVSIIFLLLNKEIFLGLFLFGLLDC